MAACEKDPLLFVQTCFGWGAGDLADHQGPDTWQIDVLSSIRDKMQHDQEPVRIAIASGHGIGKSALVAWLMLWSLMTRTEAKGVVTANTENQLRTKTWAELSKWHARCLGRHLFTLTATSIFSEDKHREKTWRMDMVPWSERNTEAFAGLHNEGKRVALFFDEASAIPDKVWEVAEGAMTDANTQILWCAFGNPTQVTGRFHGCFHRYKHRWITRQIDSRSSRFTNKVQIAKWIEDYGEDSDFARVRVRGVFPRAGSKQFIPSDRVFEAVKRTVVVPDGTPKIMAVDVARFGDDQTVIARRHGRKLEELEKFRGLDTMQVAALVAQKHHLYKPDILLVDDAGVGGGVVDRLRQLGFNVTGVIAGSKPDPNNALKYLNKRAEMWDRMRDWLAGGDIPDDIELASDLTSPEYGYDKEMRLKLESKDSMKSRGIGSPDCGDALAMTFAYTVASKTMDRVPEPEEIPDY